MSATRPVGELREQASALIAEKLKSISVTHAAHDLKVSRQAIYGFKNGSFCPSMAVIQRACKAWGMEFSINGMKVSGESFKAESSRRSTSSTEQLTFFDLWTQLQDQRMTVVRARRIDGAVEMTLRIAVPA